jgi:hypothetical protein
MLRLRILVLLVLVACGSNSKSSDIPNSEPSTDKDTQAPTPTPIIELTNQIQDAWIGFTSQSSSEYPSSSLQIIGDSIVGFRAKYGECSAFPYTLGEVQIFKWEYSAFIPLGNLKIEGSGEDSDWIQFLDVTDDGPPELVVQIFCEEYFTSVYSVGSQGIFELVQASYLRDGVLKRYEELCRPDCASGAVNYYQLVWNGRTFDEILIEKQLPYVVGRDFAGQDLSGWDMAGWDLSGADLNVANLLGSNLQGANLSGVNLSAADLTGANLSGANLSDANLGDANLSDANLEGADLRGAMTMFTNLSGANLQGANLTGVYLDATDLTGATMPDGSIFIPGPDYNPRADGCSESC